MLTHRLRTGNPGRDGKAVCGEVPLGILSPSFPCAPLPLSSLSLCLVEQLAPTPLPWKNPRCWAGASVPCIRAQGGEGAGGEGEGSGPSGKGGRLTSNSPPHPHPHPHVHPEGPRDGGGWGAGLEDRTSSWQDTGRQAGGSSPSQGYRGKRSMGPGAYHFQDGPAPQASPSYFEQ